ncbi:hypothetical protein SAMN02927921_02548 [Sinomicrobium oceani]|uniref:Uncharacterized protein n=1 Tax=Sinomicrobium oceani TaxID=1150368 RepID=A0A1K1QHD3_9FLAO|nr:hypothetical protein SAMN02927921_02548 [Sinomicrobium oceani]
MCGVMQDSILGGKLAYTFLLTDRFAFGNFNSLDSVLSVIPGTSRETHRPAGKCSTVLLMVSSTVFHISRDDTADIGINIFVLTLAGFVARVRSPNSGKYCVLRLTKEHLYSSGYITPVPGPHLFSPTNKGCGLLR